MASETEKAFLSQLDQLCRANLIEVKMKTWEPGLLSMVRGEGGVGERGEFL